MIRKIFIVLVVIIVFGLNGCASNKHAFESKSSGLFSSTELYQKDFRTVGIKAKPGESFLVWLHSSKLRMKAIANDKGQIAIDLFKLAPYLNREGDSISAKRITEEVGGKVLTIKLRIPNRRIYISDLRKGKKVVVGNITNQSFWPQEGKVIAGYKYKDRWAKSRISGAPFFEQRIVKVPPLSEEGFRISFKKPGPSFRKFYLDVALKNVKEKIKADKGSVIHKLIPSAALLGAITYAGIKAVKSACSDGGCDSSGNVSKCYQVCDEKERDYMKLVCKDLSSNTDKYLGYGIPDSNPRGRCRKKVKKVGASCRSNCY